MNFFTSPFTKKEKEEEGIKFTVQQSTHSTITMGENLFLFCIYKDNELLSKELTNSSTGIALFKAYHEMKDCLVSGVFCTVEKAPRPLDEEGKSFIFMDSRNYKNE